ncbi:MAG: UbiX family flavin prenyltransferase [Gammaproteobacteria bacterium]|nr:UbiX family flavin prenyltransferase [Gammaproteobacteria bacterium]
MANGTISVALTGASGMPYGLRLLELLLQTEDTINLMVSDPARVVMEHEVGLRLPEPVEEIRTLLEQRFSPVHGRLHVYGRDDWMSPVASGTGVPDAMVVCPCSMGTLASIAGGVSRSLIERAADVVLKEKRKLILVPRDTPFSVIHLENMLVLARMGAVILPPNPGFYHHPDTIRDLVDFVVARILDHLDIDQNLVSAWGALTDG